MKKRIRLTENDLHRIVKESVKRLLKEENSETEVIDALTQAERLLRFAYPAIIELNRDGQFDYVTNSTLGDVVMNIEGVLKKIGKIVWQN